MFFFLETPDQRLSVAVILLVATSIVAVYRFCGMLRARHAETWAELGKPDILRNFPPSVQWRFNLFVWRRRYKSLQDRRLNQVGLLIKAVWVAVVVCLLILAV